MTNISILGCGWLGLPLAEALLKKSFHINGSTTSETKIALLRAKGIRPFQIAVSEAAVIGDIAAFLENSEILIIDIPPKSSTDFVRKIATLIPFIAQSKISAVIFISSTSVFADEDQLVSDFTLPKPITENGRQLVNAEALLKNNSKFRTTVIRFGGLIGEDRHPIKYLAGKTEVENPEAPINLIHQEDCIGIISTIIEKEMFGETFNAVAPYHPTRKTYYAQKAIERRLDPPQFNESKPSVGKTILSERIETVLGYRFVVPKL